MFSRLTILSISRTSASGSKGSDLAVVFDAPASCPGGLRPLLSDRAQGISAPCPASPVTIERPTSVRHSMFGPSSVGPTTTASADFRRPIPAPYDAGSTRQDSGSPRVKRVTFAPNTCRIYGRTFRVILGFGFLCPLAQMRTPLCVSCSSGRHFAYSFLQTPPRGDALAVRLTVPITRARRGLSPPSHRPDTIRPNRAAMALRAMPGAHKKGPRRFAPAGLHFGFFL